MEEKKRKSPLRDIYLRIGRRYFEWDDKLHIQQIENGFVFVQKHYPDIKSLIPAIEEALRDFFEGKSTNK